MLLHRFAVNIQCILLSDLTNFDGERSEIINFWFLNFPLFFKKGVRWRFIRLVYIVYLYIRLTYTYELVKYYILKPCKV